MYVPLRLVPADAAVNVTVAPVSSVTVNEFPDWIASLIVAVILIVAPCLYDPSDVVEEKDDTVGGVTSPAAAVVKLQLVVSLMPE